MHARAPGSPPSPAPSVLAAVLRSVGSLTAAEPRGDYYLGADPARRPESDAAVTHATGAP